MATTTQPTEEPIERSAPDVPGRPYSHIPTATTNGDRPWEHSLRHTQDATTDLFAGGFDLVHRFAPAIARPTEAVDYTFELAAELLEVGHRISYELAALLESGTAGRAPSARRSG